MCIRDSAHILLTIRAMDEHGKWLPKARKVYDLDENGERIRLPSGNWKCHKENTVDWNDQKYAEVWRHSWETIINRYLEAAGRPERVDLRSFEPVSYTHLAVCCVMKSGPMCTCAMEGFQNECLGL